MQIHRSFSGGDQKRPFLKERFPIEGRLNRLDRFVRHKIPPGLWTVQTLRSQATNQSPPPLDGARVTRNSGMTQFPPFQVFPTSVRWVGT